MMLHLYYRALIDKFRFARLVNFDREESRPTRLHLTPHPNMEKGSVRHQLHHRKLYRSLRLCMNEETAHVR